MNGEELLAKIDELRKRLDVTYKEAKEALEKTGGNVLEALVLLEEAKAGLAARLQKKSEGLPSCLKSLAEKGTSTRILVKKGEKTLFEFPATAGVLGLVGMLVSAELAVLGAVGTVTALLNKCTLEVVPKEAAAPPAGEARSQETG